MFNWRRMFTDLGWAMSMTDPMCYSYYLASRLDSLDGKGTPDACPGRLSVVCAIGIVRDRRFYGGPAREVDRLFDSLPRTVCGTPGRSVTQTRETDEYVRHALTRPDGR